MFTTSIAVRDHECDIQGIVNNSVYQNYLEHARHLLLKACNLDFYQLAKQNINLVVVHIEMDFKYSLRSGDTAIVQTEFEFISPLRIAFYQTIFQEHSNIKSLVAKSIIIALNQNNKPFFPKNLKEAIMKNTHL